MNTIRKTTVVRATAVLLLFVTLFGALAMQASRTVAAQEEETYEIKILPIGDSITYGYVEEKQSGCTPVVTTSNRTEKYTSAASYRWKLHQDLKAQYASDPSVSQVTFVGSDDKSQFWDSNNVLVSANETKAWCSEKYPGATPKRSEIPFVAAPNRTSTQINGGGTEKYRLKNFLGSATFNETDHVYALVHLGTNDIKTDDWHTKSPKAFEGILNELKALTTGTTPRVAEVRVYLAKIIPGNAEDENITEERVRKFNEWLDGWYQTVATPMTTDEFKVYLVDMNTDFDRGAWTSDDVHPNHLGDAELARRWFNAILNSGVSSIEFPPVARDDRYHTSKGQPLDWPNVLANDVDVTGFPHIYFTVEDNKAHELLRERYAWAEGGLDSAGASPILAGSMLGAHHRNLYYIGTDRHVHELAYRETQQAWTHTDLTAVAQSASSTLPVVSGEVLVVTNSNGDPRIYYFVTFDDGQHVYELASVLGNWYGRDVTADAGGVPAAPNSPLAATTAVNDPHVYYVGSDSHIYELSWYVDKWTSNDVTVAGNGLWVALPGSVAATSFDFEPHVFYVAQDQAGLHIRELTRTGGTWLDRDVSSNTPTDNNVTEAGALSVNGRDVYYVGADKHIHQQAWDSAGQNWVHLDLSELIASGQPQTVPDAVGNVLAMTTAQGEPLIYYLTDDPDDEGYKIQEFSWTSDSGWQHTDLKGEQGEMAMDPRALAVITTGTDSPPLTVQLVSEPVGSLTLDPNGNFTYWPDDLFEGTDSFTYRVVDSSGASSGLATVLIDVVPCEPVANNLVKNFCFVTGRRPWRVYHDNRETNYLASRHYSYAGLRSAEITVNAAGENVQFYQTGIDLLPDTTYEVSFAAYSSDGTDMRLYVHRHGKPYTNYGLQGYLVDLGQDWQVHRLTFTTPDLATMHNARLRFWFVPFAQAGTVYHIDHVVLRPVTTRP